MRTTRTTASRARRRRRSRAATRSTLGNINTLIAAVNKLWGKKRIWITEYGVADAPGPALRRLVSRSRRRTCSQSFAIARANPRIDMMVWFMLRDDTNLGIGWQSGFLTARAARSPRSPPSRACLTEPLVRLPYRDAQVASAAGAAATSCGSGLAGEYKTGAGVCGDYRRRVNEGRRRYRRCEPGCGLLDRSPALSTSAASSDRYSRSTSSTSRSTA